MQPELTPSLRSAIRTLIDALVAREFARLVADGRAGRLNEAELQRALADYGRRLVPLPEEAWGSVGVFPLRDEPVCLFVDVALWTEEEGRSDLTLTLEARQTNAEWRLTISDLHVM